MSIGGHGTSTQNNGPKLERLWDLHSFFSETGFGRAVRATSGRDLEVAALLVAGGGELVPRGSSEHVSLSLVGGDRLRQLGSRFKA